MAIVMTTSTAFIEQLRQFLDASPTPYHAVDNMAVTLAKAGYQALALDSDWSSLAAGKYYLTCDGGAIIAFHLPPNYDLAKQGIHIVGAHTDSPCLKVKPNADIYQHGVLQLGVEVYGGMLLNPWFDRDLSIAGRVHYLDKKAQLQQRLIDFSRPIATIPSLAIHLDRQANDQRTVNPQQHMAPVLMQCEKDAACFNDVLLKILQGYDSDITQIVSYDLSFYDYQTAAIVGLTDDYISSARLDNLLSCYVGLQAILQSQSNQASLLVCYDHEEVGSVSPSGAQGPLLSSVLKRLCGNESDFYRMIEQSMCISVDNAHAIHPNYADKHDAYHGPMINAGPVIKLNANQRYASSSATAAYFSQLCASVQVPVQQFVMRNDMRCGSTIGPITAGELGIKTVDVGLPSWGMHSIREHAGTRDSWLLFKVLQQFYANED